MFLLGFVATGFLFYGIYNSISFDSWMEIIGHLHNIVSWPYNKLLPDNNEKESKEFKIVEIYQDSDRSFDIIFYKLNGNVHRLHAESTDVDHHEILKNYTVESDSINETKFLRKVVMAELSNDNQKEDVSHIIKEAQGPKHNFHFDIDHSTKNWDHVLHEYELDDWDILTIVDSFGHIHKIEIKNPELRKLKWNPNFDLI